MLQNTRRSEKDVQSFEYRLKCFPILNFFLALFVELIKQLGIIFQRMWYEAEKFKFYLEDLQSFKGRNIWM